MRDTRRVVAWIITRLSRERNLPATARESAGTVPSRYRSVSIPCASGENTMLPAPTSSSTGKRPVSGAQVERATDDRPLRRNRTLVAEVLPHPQRDGGELKPAGGRCGCTSSIDIGRDAECSAWELSR
jgi:hypothetical protein